MYQIYANNKYQKVIPILKLKICVNPFVICFWQIIIKIEFGFEIKYANRIVQVKIKAKRLSLVFIVTRLGLKMPDPF